MTSALFVFLLVASCGHLGVGQIVQQVRGELQPFGATRDLGVVLVDAGSTGSKVYAFSRQEAKRKLVVHCSDAEMAAGLTNQGVASLAYSDEACHWLQGTEEEAAAGELRHLARAEDHADALLAVVREAYGAASADSDLAAAGNAEAVPVLATAGMRLLSTEANARVWSRICGKSGHGFTFAPHGEQCGTIPGTTEAYFEFLANAAFGSASHAPTGTFTMGGASAQIAIPLVNASDVEDFLAMRAAVEREINCTALTLQDGSPAPIFGPRGTTRQLRADLAGRLPRTACLDDYVTVRSRDDIEASTAVLRRGVGDLRGVGLISFLGLRGRGTLVAGGLNELGYWAADEGCADSTRNFTACAARLRRALGEDVLWRHVTAYFATHALNVHDFSYNTYAALPSLMGLHVGQRPDSEKPLPEGEVAFRLEEELARRCGRDNGLRFGYHDADNCMQGLYVSLYITSFFTRTPEEGKHSADEVLADPRRELMEGELEDLLVVRKPVAEHEHAAVRALLAADLRRHAAHYATGAGLHFASRSAKLQRPVGSVAPVPL